MRRKQLWELGSLRNSAGELDLQVPGDEAQFAPLTIEEAMSMEHEMLGFSVREHPMSLYREDLKERGILGSADLERSPHNSRVCVAGKVIVHQAPPTPRGYHFITLEDEDGFIDVIVMPPTYAQFRHVIRSAGFLVVSGTVQREGAIVNMIAAHIKSLAYQQTTDNWPEQVCVAINYRAARNQHLSKHQGHPAF